MKNWSKIHFFLKCLCGPTPIDLDQHIWQIISKLVIFCEVIIGDPQSDIHYFNFVVESNVIMKQ